MNFQIWAYIITFHQAILSKTPHLSFTEQCNHSTSVMVNQVGIRQPTSRYDKYWLLAFLQQIATDIYWLLPFCIIHF